MFTVIIRVVLSSLRIQYFMIGRNTLISDVISSETVFSVGQSSCSMVPQQIKQQMYSRKLQGELSSSSSGNIWVLWRTRFSNRDRVLQIFLSCSANSVLPIVQQGQQQHRCSAYHSCVVVGGQQQPDIISVTGDGVETMCCGSSCSTRTLSSLRGSVIFCSIRCVQATRFDGEARIYVFSNTHKSLLKFPPRDDLIRFINHFLIFPESKLREYDYLIIIN